MKDFKGLMFSTATVLMLLKIMPDDLYSLPICLRMYDLKLTYFFILPFIIPLICVLFTLFYRDQRISFIHTMKPVSSIALAIIHQLLFYRWLEQRSEPSMSQSGHKLI